jgi:hypothetical protein
VGTDFARKVVKKTAPCAQSLAAQNHQNSRQHPQRRGGDEALYLAIENAGMHWRRTIEWTNAMGQFAIQFGDRFPKAPTAKFHRNGCFWYELPGHNSRHQ